MNMLSNNLNKEDNESIGSLESGDSSRSPTSETSGSIVSSKQGNAMMEITKGEERAVSWIRFVFLLVLLAAAIILGAVVFMIAKDEIDDFETQVSGGVSWNS